MQVCVQVWRWGAGPIRRVLLFGEVVIIQAWREVLTLIDVTIIR
jgi:hypothetical protein